MAGKHAEAAQAYADLAAQSPAEHDNYELLSAEQWVLADNIAQAKQAFAAVSPEARTSMPASRALVAAEIALAENDGARAIHELDYDPGADFAGARAELLVAARQGRVSHRASGRGHARLRRARALHCGSRRPCARAARSCCALLRDAAERGTSLKAPPKTDPVVAGWLALGPVAVEMARNPTHAAAALADWKRAYPQHPGADSVLAGPVGPSGRQVRRPVRSGAKRAGATGTEFPEQIALLLPLSGRSESVGVAVRDGFIAAYLQQDPATRPLLKIYDIAAETVAGAYRHAVDDGAGIHRGSAHQGGCRRGGAGERRP